MDEKLLYRVEEAGRLLNMGRSTIFEKLANGELKSVQIGRSQSIQLSAVSRLPCR